MGEYIWTDKKNEKGILAGFALISFVENAVSQGFKSILHLSSMQILWQFFSPFVITRRLGGW